MASNLRRIGNVDQNAFLRTLPDYTPPILVRKTGETFSLESLHALRDVELTNHDALVVHPHGDTLFLAAEGLRQGILESQKSVHLLLDAHEDHLRTASTNHKVFDADRTAQILGDYLQCPSSEVFSSLVEVASGDIATFIAALRYHLTRVVALVRKVQNVTRLYDCSAEEYTMMDAPCDCYSQFTFELAYRLAEKLRTAESMLISVDGDITSAKRARAEWLATGMEPPYQRTGEFSEPGVSYQSAMAVTQGFLENAVAPVARNATGVLYGISVDPEWCYYSGPFLIAFFRDYYRKCVMCTNG